MGGFVSIGAVHSEDCELVFKLLAQYFTACGRPTVEPDQYQYPALHTQELYEQSRGWVMLQYACWRDWDHFRQMQRFLTGELRTTALLAFIYDGDYWGYEATHSGRVVDNFVGWPWDDRFPDRTTDGNPAALSALFPNADPGVVAAYLTRAPDVMLADDADDETASRAYRDTEELDVKVCTDDHATRFDAWVMFDFLRHLGLPAIKDVAVVRRFAISKPAEPDPRFARLYTNGYPEMYLRQG